MEAETRCPTCKHAHPAGIGAKWCGCSDCFLLWTDIPYEHLGETARKRLAELTTIEVGGQP